MNPSNDNDDVALKLTQTSKIILQCLLSALALGFFVWANAWVYGG